MDAIEGPDGVEVRLTSDEALVLFEWLHAWESRDRASTSLAADAAEQRVLWDLSASLEGLLVEPFESNYADLLEAARRRLRPAAE